MSWERRRGELYYYRSVRIDGRPRKVYFGSGEEALAQQARDIVSRDRRRAERDALASEWARVAAADAALARFLELAELLTRAVLILSGHHQHHGEWRLRRGQPQCNGDGGGGPER